MAYDIPPPLQHKEKILFGLTFQQLGYAAPAFLLLVIIILKIKMSIYVSGTIGILISLIAVFFMFFDGMQRIRNLYNYFKNPQMTVFSKELKQIVDIKQIKEGVVHKSHEKLAILEITPMNFMLKTEEEKHSVIIGFQKFLNSLDFSVQIHITSVPIALEAHFEYSHKKALEKIESVKKDSRKTPEEKAEATAYLEQLIDSYCTFVKDMIKNNNILNRTFYLVIKEKTNIDIQANICAENLKRLGLKVRQLQTNEVIQYFYTYIAQKKQKTTDKEEVSELAHFLYAPEKVDLLPDAFIADGLYCKVLAVIGYPHSVEVGFLDKIISSGEKYDISIHIEPFPIDFTMIQLNRDLQKQQADLYTDSKKGILNPSLEIKFSSTRKVLEDLQKGRQKLFNVSLYIMCKEENTKEGRKKVELLAQKVKAELDGLMIQSTIPKFQMMEAYASMLPLANNRLNIKQNIHTEGLGAFFPFSSPFLDIENDGILLGLNKNKIPYIKNIFNLANANGIILATSGAGKSYFTKLLLSRQFMNGCDIIIIDPQGEYSGITEHYKGECITLSKDSDTIINPLDLMGHEYLEKRLSLMDLFKIMFEGDINELQKSILDKAIDMTYENQGITAKAWAKNVPPTMTDLYKMLEKLETWAVQQEKVTYRALMNRIHMYTSKGVFGFLDRHSKINYNNRFVCFNIGNMPKQVKAVVMYLVLDYVYMKMKESKNRKLLVIDEAWSLLQTAEESSYIFEIVKTCRKHNLGLLMITQDVADLVASKAGHAVLANTSYTFLLRQKPAVIHGVASTFHLSLAEKEFLMAAKQGNGILILENEHQELEVIASPKEHELITTNPNEVLKKEKKEEVIVKESERADIDLSKPVFSAKGLTPLQINVLNNHGYILKKCHNLESGPFSYYIKPQHPESAEHTFLVWIIYEEIRKHTDEVWIYRTKKPDIIFVNKIGQEIALEIETGFEFDKHKERLEKKFAELKKVFCGRYYIVLTDLKIKNRYLRFESPILSRADIKQFVTLQFSSLDNAVIGARLKVTNKDIS